MPRFRSAVPLKREGSGGRGLNEVLFVPLELLQRHQLIVISLVMVKKGEEEVVMVMGMMMVMVVKEKERTVGCYLFLSGEKDVIDQEFIHG